MGTYGNASVHAPDLRIKTMSPGTGRYSDFTWSPYNNEDSQGPLVEDAWNLNVINQASGSNASWPTGSTGGSGWSCNLGCYFPINSTSSNLTYPASIAEATFRNLETYIAALLGTDRCTETSCAISDAVITGIEVVLGSPGAEASWVAYTQDVHVAASGYDWSWTFECAASARVRRQRRQLHSRDRIA